jgi:hypothetical protein
VGDGVSCERIPCARAGSRISQILTEDFTPQIGRSWNGQNRRAKFTLSLGHFLCITQTMAKSALKVIPKKRGRPATGKDPLVAIRMPQELIDEIDAWAKRYANEGRSRAIRRLVDLGLKAKGRKAQ